MRNDVLWLSVTLLALGGACTSSYQQRETTGVQASAFQLDSGKSVLVTVPADGSYGDRTYAGTGRTVAQKTAAAFSRYSRRVEVAAPEISKRDDLLAEARKIGAGYLVIPTVTHWEVRATEWSGIPSRVSISIAILDVATGRELRSTLLESRSAVMTFVRPNPDALAEHMINENVSALYVAKPQS